MMMNQNCDEQLMSWFAGLLDFFCNSCSAVNLISTDGASHCSCELFINLNSLYCLSGVVMNDYFVVCIHSVCTLGLILLRNIVDFGAV